MKNLAFNLQMKVALHFDLHGHTSIDTQLLENCAQLLMKGDGTLQISNFLSLNASYLSPSITLYPPNRQSVASFQNTLNTKSRYVRGDFLAIFVYLLQANDFISFSFI